jgi:hypothetical protein
MSATPAVFADPVRVALAWMDQWCATDYREPINTNLRRAAVFQTADGAASDLAEGGTSDTYDRARQQRLVAVCDDVTATLIPEAPATQSQVYVVITARRALAVDQSPLQYEHLHQVRLVEHASGRWLVDLKVDAG